MFMKTRHPDPSLLELARKIIDQNESILKMNAKLLALLSAPLVMVKPPQP